MNGKNNKYYTLSKSKTLLILARGFKNQISLLKYDVLLFIFKCKRDSHVEIQYFCFKNIIVLGRNQIRFGSG